ncbi:MAG: MetQ/NlpA family ABC transporter substrate-binding protein [Defluviitaleaceae bacterium]|nr:MetQ/NlpA family ABC transporter substrate-binding protein [Defluviitaleaceae bacterium]
MKKLLMAMLLAFVLGAFIACGGADTDGIQAGDDGVYRIVIGATPRPHMEILEYIRPFLLEDGIELILQEFTDFHILNPAVVSGDLHANYFQHAPFLNDSPQADQLQMIGLIHIEPMGAYSLTLESIVDLPEGATVAIPNDATNGGRALLLLQTHGLLTVDSAAGVRVAVSDITYNPLNLNFQQLDAALLPAMLSDPQVDMAIINTNHVLAATQLNLNPVRDSLIIETVDTPFANGLAVPVAYADHHVFATILSHLQSEHVRAFIWREYDGAVVPVF